LRNPLATTVSLPTARILLFYTVFYTALAALFAICMQGLFATLNYDHPKWQMANSRIGSNPGLNFRPMPPNVEIGKPPKIKYNSNKKKDIEIWVKRLDDFLKRKFLIFK
jgi:sodium/potassium-transporting ATPase subunit beta